jgi:hypothetical protein
MPSRARWLVVAACLLAPGIGAAQPAPGQGDKVDAKSLMQSGVRLLEAKDYLGALAVFKDAYARFPSAKILLNIGTTLSLLDRKVDAANAYQKYLDAPDTDPAKKPDVTTALAELDKFVGRLEISVTPPDAEVQINEGEWMPAPAAHLYRIPAGQFRVSARKDKFQQEAKAASISTGEKAGISIALTALPEQKQVFTSGNTGLDDGGGIGVGTQVEEPRSKLSGMAIAHLDIPRGGGAVLLGIGFDISTAFQVHAAAILGPTYGGYGGASFAFLDGTLRPYLAAGMPIFISNGARAGVRAAGGVELAVTRHVSLIVDLGGELMLNPEDNILQIAFIPAVGASGRL